MNRSEASDRAHPSRRDVILLGVGAFAVAAAPAVVRRKQVLTRRSIPVMGTIGEIAVVHRDPRYAHQAIDAAIAELREVERTMTRFTPTSDIGRANLRAATQAVSISPATATVVEEGIRWAEVSDGAFDPCIGRAVELWDVTNRRVPPPADDVRRLANHGLYRSLDLNTWRGEPVVRFASADVRLDLGGIAKGYGVDRAVEALREWGIQRALVNVGGDLHGMGESEDGDPWHVGVRSPEDPSMLAGTLDVADRAVATSGDYLQFFKYGNRRYHHLLDPKTGAPRQSRAHSITVTADRCMTADAAATAVFGMPEIRAEGLLRVRAPGARIVHSA
jgi:thiamine biosynthesis lipoprotein